MIRTYGLGKSDDGYEVKSSSEIYTFKTQEFAALFCKLLNQYETSKYLTQVSNGATITRATNFHGTPTFQFSLGGVNYTLDLSKPPNLCAKMLLTLIGFKK